MEDDFIISWLILIENSHNSTSIWKLIKQT